MPTIPASALVNVTPSVLGVGGDGLDVIGLVLTTSTRVPIGTVQSFPSAAAVADFFGAGSAEAIIAGGGTNKGSGYFGGFTGANKLPASILFAQYNQAAVAAYLQGGDVSGLTLAALQAISGTLAVTIDGYARAAGAVNLSAATSFSSAAAIIQTALNAATATAASFTGAISGTTLTVSALGSGALAVGQTVVGASAGTIITALGSGTGGTGTYVVNNSQSLGSGALTSKGTDVAVTYDSVSGGFKIASGITGVASTSAFATGAIAATLMLTAATGAAISQGAIAAVPATFMDGVVQQTTNWVTFMTSFDPDGSGNSVKQAFAAWVNGKNNRYAYICWDTDITPTTALPAVASLGYLLAQNGNSGTCLIYDATDLNLAAFICGAAAAIDFTQTNGRITFAFKSQPGLQASVVDATVASNLGGNPQTSDRGNGYNFYGAYASANENFTWFQRGFITGPFSWLDSFINQVWLNSQFQLALLTLQANALSIPYTTGGEGLIEQALADPIAAGLNFGAFAPGAISSSQISDVNAAAGANVAGTLQTQGWYLQVKAASSASRAARTTPPCTFWYLDRGSVQSINLGSVALQ